MMWVGEFEGVSGCVVFLFEIQWKTLLEQLDRRKKERSEGRFSMQTTAGSNLLSQRCCELRRIASALLRNRYNMLQLSIEHVARLFKFGWAWQFKFIQVSCTVVEVKQWSAMQFSWCWAWLWSPEAMKHWLLVILRIFMNHSDIIRMFLFNLFRSLTQIQPCCGRGRLLGESRDDLRIATYTDRTEQCRALIQIMLFNCLYRKSKWFGRSLNSGQKARVTKLRG